MMQHSDIHLAALAHHHLSLNSLNPDVETPTGDRPLGEARNIFDKGGHYLSLLGGNPLFHHPADRWPNAVDLESTTQWARWIVDCVNQLSRH